MKGITPYLVFDGRCREAMQFYEKCLGGQLFIMTFSEAPLDFPKEAKDKILHATLTTGSGVLMAADTMPGTPFQQGNNFSVAFGCESLQEIERLFAVFAEKGEVTMPLQETFWAARFGTLTDQFGINWMFQFDKTTQGKT